MISNTFWFYHIIIVHPTFLDISDLEHPVFAIQFQDLMVYLNRVPNPVYLMSVGGFFYRELMLYNFHFVLMYIPDLL